MGVYKTILSDIDKDHTSLFKCV